MTGSTVWGAARAYRGACLADVLPARGADGLGRHRRAEGDARGWTTTAFEDLPFRHHRARGRARRPGLARARGPGPRLALHGLSGLVPLLRALCNARREPAGPRRWSGATRGRASRGSRRRRRGASAVRRRQQSLRSLGSARSRRAGGASSGSRDDRARTDRADVLLVCTAGGHLLQLWSLRDAWGRLHARLGRRSTRATSSRCSADERVFFAHSPTNRSLKNLVPQPPRSPGACSASCAPGAC